MPVYLVTHEDSEDGLWFDDPGMFDSEFMARAWAIKQGAPAKGYCRILYRCDEIETLSETPLAEIEAQS